MGRKEKMEKIVTAIFSKMKSKKKKKRKKSTES